MYICILNANYRFNLYCRLFIVMGLSWFLEILSYATGSEHALSFIFAVTDIFNALLGLIIFIILVANPKVWKLIKKRYFSVIYNCYVVLKKIVVFRFFIKKAKPDHNTDMSDCVPEQMILTYNLNNE